MTVEVRELTDVRRLIGWRREVIAEVFGEEPSRQLMEANEKYYREALAFGEHVAVVATVDGREAGCGGLCLSCELPSPDNPTGICGYLMNIYVRPPYRRLGVGHSIVSRLVREAEKRRCGKIYLETTDRGRSLYRSCGFDDMTGMMKLPQAVTKSSDEAVESSSSS